MDLAPTQRSATHATRTLTGPAMRRRVRGAAGMTLIEILVVITIAALMISAVALGVRSVPRTRLRSSAVRTAAAMHFAYVHALSTGHTTRIAFRLGAPDVGLEESDDTYALDPHDPMRAGGSADVAQDALAQARLQYDMRPRATRASFRPVHDWYFARHGLDQGIRVVRLYTQHDDGARTEGRGSIYFFPGGRTERAVVWLRNERGEIYSVTLNPLTGRTEVFDRAVEPPTVEDRDSDQYEQNEHDREPGSDTPTANPNAEPAGGGAR